jgi:hypothetical protein
LRKQIALIIDRDGIQLNNAFCGGDVVGLLVARVGERDEKVKEMTSYDSKRSFMPFKSF